MRKAYNEVMTVGSVSSTERPQDRADVVLFYAGIIANSGLNQAARQVAAATGAVPCRENARAFALINMAMNDSLVASFLQQVSLQFLASRNRDPCG